MQKSHRGFQGNAEQKVVKGLAQSRLAGFVAPINEMEVVFAVWKDQLPVREMPITMQLEGFNAHFRPPCPSGPARQQPLLGEGRRPCPHAELGIPARARARNLPCRASPAGFAEMPAERRDRAPSRQAVRPGRLQLPRWQDRKSVV